MTPRRKSSRKRVIQTKALKKGRFPKIKGRGDRTKAVNSTLVRLAKKTEDQLDYWRAFQSYLTDQREQRRDQLIEALQSQAQMGFSSDDFVRIVDSRYQTRPLSSYGSVVVAPGGRFNFGKISDYYVQFQALYLASDFPTAIAERFLRDQKDTKQVDQTSLDLRLDPNASFGTYRVRVSHLSLIDLRNPKSLEPFAKILSEIKPAPWLKVLAKQLNQPEPRTVQSPSELKKLILERLFTQWGMFIDHPSPSQWFGYYVREAGINGVIYPSVQNKDGFNLAVFPDTFTEGLQKIELIDPVGGVARDESYLDANNFKFHSQGTENSPGGTIH